MRMYFCLFIQRLQVQFHKQMPFYSIHILNKTVFFPVCATRDKINATTMPMKISIDGLRLPTRQIKTDELQDRDPNR